MLLLSSFLRLFNESARGVVVVSGPSVLPYPFVPLPLGLNREFLEEDDRSWIRRVSLNKRIYVLCAARIGDKEGLVELTVLELNYKLLTNIKRDFL